MCKFWRKEKFNHHFPELNRKNKLIRAGLMLFNWRRGAVLAMAATVIVGVFYLTQINSAATAGYKLKELQQKFDTLKDENKKLSLRYIQSQSIANLTAKANDLKLVAVGEVEIINPVAATVARR